MSGAGPEVNGNGKGGIRRLLADGRFRRLWVAQMVSGIGEMIAAGFTRESSEQAAEQKEAEAAAQLAETGAQREQDFLTQLTDLINKITSLMQDIQQTNNESARRAASV